MALENKIIKNYSHKNDVELFVYALQLTMEFFM